jgi:hypothetical protein
MAPATYDAPGVPLGSDRFQGRDPQLDTDEELTIQRPAEAPFSDVAALAAVLQWTARRVLA